MGCPPEAAAVEVLPAEYPVPGDVRIGRVTLCKETTINSPFFWLALGGVSAAVLTYMIMRDRRQNNRG